jgi:hypothetical protein
MYPNPYLAEKLANMHRDDLLREAADKGMKAHLPQRHTHLWWRDSSTVGALLIRLGSWLERSASHDEPAMLDIGIDNTTGAA